MNARNIGLMITGAVGTVGVILAATFFNTPEAHAQGAAAAPGAVAITVTANPSTSSLVANTTAGVTACGGVITIHDAANRKVIVVSYVNNISYTSGGFATAATVALSTNASFTY